MLLKDLEIELFCTRINISA